MLGVGLRWKPWRSRIVYLAAENQVGLDDTSRRDVLLRASASFLGGGRSSDDWHPSGSGWIAKNLYIDTAHYLKTSHTAFTADFRTSYHRKMAASQTIEPYSHLQFNGITNEGFRLARRSATHRTTTHMTTRSGHELMQPSSLDWSVQEGRDAYLAENGFTVESYDAKWTPASLLGITFAVPNTKNHRRAIMWHDLHHVATGIGTDPAGEGEIAMWEMRRRRGTGGDRVRQGRGERRF
jgi:hypothetical protein